MNDYLKTLSVIYCRWEKLVSDSATQEEIDHHAKLIKYLVDWITTYADMKTYEKHESISMMA